MADDEKKPQGLAGPVNPHTGQPNAAWQNILAGAAAGMAGQPNPYLAQLKQQQAAQAQALQTAKASQAAQLANYGGTQQAHMQDPAVQQAAIQAAAHPGPAPGGLAGNPMAPGAAQQMQQMGAQAAQQMTPEEQQRRLAMAQAPLAVSDERLKRDVDRAGVERQMRRFLDSLDAETPRREPSYDSNTLAGRAFRNG